ncbi:hypothetical protein RRG08_060411 [Elysia crispata]|uniref:Uncharacterized protein n=1 Tax=Elysia crispata TaxID=231223 RepID=A0AAE1ALH9_9GAST|nr:hypothetical protein RRG08_060411 [Elysia crispata]
MMETFSIRYIDSRETGPRLPKPVSKPDTDSRETVRDYLSQCLNQIQTAAGQVRDYLTQCLNQTQTAARQHRQPRDSSRLPKPVSKPDTDSRETGPRIPNPVSEPDTDSRETVRDYLTQCLNQTQTAARQSEIT